MDSGGPSSHAPDHISHAGEYWRVFVCLCKHIVWKTDHTQGASSAGFGNKLTIRRKSPSWNQSLNIVRAYELKCVSLSIHSSLIPGWSTTAETCRRSISRPNRVEPGAPMPLLTLDIQEAFFNYQSHTAGQNYQGQADTTGDGSLNWTRECLCRTGRLVPEAAVLTPSSSTILTESYRRFGATS